MKAGQITAKLRDAVPVCFYEDGEECIRYRNIDIPDCLKELEIVDFQFNVSPGEKITFRLFFERGTLPVEFPPAREKMTREEKAEAKTAKAKKISTEDLAAAAADVISVVTGSKVTIEPETISPQMPDFVETVFNVTGGRRKELVAAISAILNQSHMYLGAPSFVYAIGPYRVDKVGTLIGEPSQNLLDALAEQGFVPETK